jgi:hypothetical protein
MTVDFPSLAMPSLIATKTLTGVVRFRSVAVGAQTARFSAPRHFWCYALLAIVLIGCRTRCDYRRWADHDVVCELAGKQIDLQWDIPDRPVAPHPRSRMADLSRLDCGPLPPDDPVAHLWMERPGCFDGWPCWHSRGDLSSIEFDRWLNFLPREDDGVVVLTRPRSMELALLHSREYQDQVELLYFQALALTLQRFEFATRWFARNSTFSDIMGTGPPLGTRRLTTRSNVGFSKFLPAGGQLLVDFANSFI